EIRGGEVKRDQGRVRPIEQSRRQTVVLRQREPIPRGVANAGCGPRVLPKVPQQMRLERRVWTAEPDQARRQTIARVREPTEHEIATPPVERPPVRRPEEGFHRLRPTARPPFPHPPP